MNATPRVSVYIPCRDYGRFLNQAIASVVAQSFSSWELLLIDDGSTDETGAIVARSCLDDSRIRSLRHETPRGLPASANAALRRARGAYFIRLDADDHFDENALLVLVTYLDQHPDIALVYPNYVHVDEQGRYLGVEHRKRIGTEAQLLDLPAHGACTMVRRTVLEQVGGYSETQDRQDGYDLWLKVARRYPVANIETPLFFHRHHGPSLSRDEERLLAARRRIKRAAASNGLERAGLGRCAAVVLAKNTYEYLPDVVLAPLAGRPLIDYSLDAALEVDAFDVVVVSTDDPRVADYADRYHSRVYGHVRPEGLSGQHAREDLVLHHALLHLEGSRDLVVDTIVSLAVNCPLGRGEHIQEALDTLALFETDMVISVYEDYGLHFVHGFSGLRPLNSAMHLQIRLEREALYVWNGAVRALRRDAINQDGFQAVTVGHIVMRYEDSFQIKTEFERGLVGKLLVERDTQSGAIQRVVERG